MDTDYAHLPVRTSLGWSLEVVTCWVLSLPTFDTKESHARQTTRNGSSPVWYHKGLFAPTVCEDLLAFRGLGATGVGQCLRLVHEG